MAPMAPAHAVRSRGHRAGHPGPARSTRHARCSRPSRSAAPSSTDPACAPWSRWRRHARLIALGHERHPTFDRLLTGATVTGVAAAAACPVVAVPPDWTATVEHGCVLVGVKSLDRLLAAAAPRLRDGGAASVPACSSCTPGSCPAEYDDLITARVDEVGWQDRAQHAIARAIVDLPGRLPGGEGRHPRASTARRRTPSGARRRGPTSCSWPVAHEPSRSGTWAGRPGPCCATAAAPSRWSRRRTSPSRSWTWCWSTTGVLEK